MSESDLLHRYLAERSEAALAELVRLHVNLVYGAALRQMEGDVHRAQDVAQRVFIDLARKAPVLAGRPTLAGWLHTSTRYVAATLRRAERTRERIEREAATQQAIEGGEPPVAWERLQPVIDEAIATLDERDREVVLRRFFEGRSFAEIGMATGSSPDAARMRVERALEKLRGRLARRGITSTAVALGLALEQAMATPVPSGLAQMLASGAMTAAGTTAVGGLGFWAAVQGFPVGPLTAVIAAVVAVGAAFYEGRRTRQMEADLAAVDAAVERAESRKLALQRQVEETGRALTLLRAAPPAGATPAESRTVSAPAEAPAALQSGREFLANNPKARQLLELIVLWIFERNQGYEALRSLNLSPEEYRRVLEIGARETQGVLRVGDLLLPHPIDETGGANAKAQNQMAQLAERGNASSMAQAGDRGFRAALGAERAKALDDYRKDQPYRSLVGDVMAATFDSDTPLAASDARRLMEMLRATNQGPGSNLGGMEEAVRATLAPAQWGAFQAALAQSGLARPSPTSPSVPQLPAGK